MAPKTPEQINDDLLRPLSGASPRYLIALAFLRGNRGRGRLRVWLAGLRRDRRGGTSAAGFLGFLHHEFRFLDWTEPRRHADFRDSASRECHLAASCDAMRGSDHRFRAFDRRDVSGDSPGPAVAGVLAFPVSERARHLAQYPFAAALGFFRDQYILARQRNFSCCCR